MPNPLSPALQRFKQAPRLLRYSTYALSAYALYAVTLGAVIPALIEAKAPEQLSEQLGRDVSVHKVSINPFVLRARIEGFAIQEANGSDTFTRFDEFELEFNFWQSLFALTPTVDHITLTAPQVALQRMVSDGQTRFNFSDILDTLANHASAEPVETDDAQQPDAEIDTIPAIRIQRLDISDGQVRFHDKVTGAELNYADLNLNLYHFDSRAASQTVASDSESGQAGTVVNNQYSLMIEGTDQGQLALKGQFQLAPFNVDGILQLKSVTLKPFWPFTADQMQAAVTDGAINLSAHFSAGERDDSFHYQVTQGQVQLRHLVVSDQSQAKIKLPSLDVQNVRVSGDRQQVDVDAIKLKGLWVEGEVSAQGLDLAQLFTVKKTASKKTAASPPAQSEPVQTRAEQQPATDTSTTSAPWLVRLARFAMTDTDINIKESVQSKGIFWRVYPLAVTTGPIQSDLANPIDYDIALAVSSGDSAAPQKARGELSTKGKVDAAKLSAEGDLSVNGLDLTQVQPYLAPYVNLHLTKGQLATQGHYSADNKGRATYQGSADISNLLVKDTLQNQPLVQWQKMNINSMIFNAQQQSLKIDTIAFDAPYAKVMIAKDKRTNIGDIVVQSDADSRSEPAKSSTGSPDPSTAAKQDSSAFAVDVKAITFSNGSTYFADNSLTPNFASGIELLHGSVRNLSSTPGTKAQVDIAGKIDKYAPVSLKGEINPLIPNPYLDLDLNFKSVELTSVNPYSGTYAGYYIDKGQLSLALNYQLEENQLKGDNHLVIDQLKLGKPSESKLATSLPVSLAIAMLQDRNGVIDLGVQVSGDVNDPDFSFGSIIFKALSNIVVKAVTAPFSLLANLVGSDEELDHVTFALGDASLSTDEQQRLDKLAQALASRPQLTLSIAAAVNEQDDSRAMAELRIQQRMLEQSGLNALPADFSPSYIAQSEPLADAVTTLAESDLNLNLGDERDKVVQQLKQGKTDAPSDEQVDTTLMLGLYNQLVNSVNISRDQLENLAEERAKSIKTYLVDEAMVAPERVFLLDSRTRLRTEDNGADLTLDAK